MRDPRPYLRMLERLHPKMDFAVSSDSQGVTDSRGARSDPADRAAAGGAGESGATGGAQRAPNGRAQGIDAEASRLLREAVDLDIASRQLCWVSMNIGIMLFPPGRPGALTAITEATTHLASEGNLRRVDQGPINYRWKHGAGDWRWKRELFPVRDRSGRRLCGLTNGTSVAAVLPVAQFCNTLTHSVLQLWKGAGVRPFAVHATWMRQQREP